MSFFPRAYINQDPTTSFHPLFRLLDDFDQYSRNSEGSNQTSLKTFAPKFDVKELPDSYELHGELPGIEQKDVEIEFTDSQTLTVRGHTERSSTSGTPATITEGKANEGKHDGAVASKNDAAKKPEAKYWVSERSVGEFSRAFSFPNRVDQEGVSASMKNGVLSVVVPKSKKPETRKITIS